MADFFKYLQQQKFSAGEKLEAEALIIAQKILCNMGLDFMPDSYVGFLRKFNGVKAGESYLFGATVDDALDIVDQNRQMSKPDNSILLGYNDFDLLCYNFNLKKYQIVDRTDFKVLDAYAEDELNEALLQIFNP